MVSALSRSPDSGQSPPSGRGLLTPYPPLSFDSLLAGASPADRPAWLHWQQILTDAHRESATALSIEADAACWRVQVRTGEGLHEHRLEGDEPDAMLRVMAEVRKSPGAARGRARESVREYAKESALSSTQESATCLSIRLDDQWYMLRLITLATSSGTAWHIELHPDHPVPPTLEELGMSSPLQLKLRNLLAARHGWLLVSANNPQARSALLQAMVQVISSPDRRVLCVETPIHHRLSRTTQVVLSDQPAGAKASGKRVELTPAWHPHWQAALGMAHDVVVLNDSPARLDLTSLAKRSIDQTLVIQGCTSLPGNDAGSWLKAQGFSTAWIERTLLGTVRHRSIRKLCQACRHPAPIGDEPSQWLHQAREDGGLLFDQWLRAMDRDRFSLAPGCAACHGRGFVGEVNVFDIHSFRTDHRAGASSAPRQARYRALLELAVQGEITLADAMLVHRDWFAA